MKELLFSITKKDFDISYFSGTGAGGQHRNKHQNCVRLKHRESGLLVTGQSYRERKRNLIQAFNNLINHPKFKVWYTRKVYEMTQGETLEQKVNSMLLPENLKIEYEKCGVWVEEEK